MLAKASHDSREVYKNHLSRSLVEELRTRVLQWYYEEGRDFPWRNSKNPFHILVAEILLRQTQATRLIQPYLDLINQYPDVQSMAKANAQDLRNWFKPLGLINKADLLVRAACVLINKHEGHIPRQLSSLLDIPGMGTYSARAVLCLSYGIRLPMVDGGSGRVLQRALGLASDGPAYADRHLLKIAEDILPQTFVKEYNLGLIDIAAVYCRPRKTMCEPCPIAMTCCYWQKK